MQQFLDSSPSDRISIVVDHREDKFFDDLFKSSGAYVDRRALDVGDFLCSARLVVERKTRADFESSVIDGRLFSQLPNLVSNYERVVIIVEGTKDDERCRVIVVFCITDCGFYLYIVLLNVLMGLTR